jgi:hypothetical protein
MKLFIDRPNNDSPASVRIAWLQGAFLLAASARSVISGHAADPRPFIDMVTTWGGEQTAAADRRLVELLELAWLGLWGNMV